MDLLDRLRDYFRKHKAACVAFSGGLDSAVLLRVARDVLGTSVIAATVDSETVPRSDLEDAQKFARSLNVEHVIIRKSVFNLPGFASNPWDRCKICRSSQAISIVKFCRSRGISLVVDGANASDLREHRPGIDAASSAGVRHPFIELGITKEEIRTIARKLGLEISEKPASPCLSSRIPYGEPITPDKLRQVENAEAYLKELGFKIVRVRHHGDVARIEVSVDEISRFADHELRARILRVLRAQGFNYVALDLQGYRPGAMDEVLQT